MLCISLGLMRLGLQIGAVCEYGIVGISLGRVVVALSGRG